MSGAIRETARPAHRRADGRFENPWPGDRAHGFGELMRWRRERRAKPPVPPLLPGTLPRVASSFDRPRAAPETLTATWVGHATTLLQIGSLNVLTDPMWSQRASPLSWAGPARVVPPAVTLDALPPVDMVLISHNHYDHLDEQTVKGLQSRHAEAVWMAPLGVARLLRRWGVRQVHELDWWATDRVADAEVACVPARHFSARTPWDRGKTLWCGWTIANDGWRVYFAGDTAYHPEFGQIAERHGPFDLVLLPVGAYEPRWFMGSVHMNPEDALEAYGDLSRGHPDAPAPTLLPIHWGTFRLTDEPVTEPPARLRARWADADLPGGALWLAAHGQTHRRERPG